MLLRRVIEHVKTQNWTAVGLDFVIVVVGVFIGLQVSNWNDARGDRRLEQEYLNRLHAEIEVSIVTDREDVNRESARLLALREVGEYLKDETAGALEPKHCLALYRSHIFIKEVRSIPTIDELTSVGRAHLISDSALRAAIIGFVQSRIEAAGTMENIRSGRLALSRKHPHLIRMDQTDIEGDSAFCDYSAMRQSQIFINDFTDNTVRFRRYSERTLDPHHEALIALHAEIDRVLNLKHEATGK